jgi:putative ABC transport system ATP-binding protein
MHTSPAGSPSSILSFQKVSKRFESANQPLTVLHEISFELAAGESCAVVGPSGSGKSTLLGLAAGLDLPSSGVVSLNGQALSALGEDQRSLLRLRSVGFVFQSFQLIPTLTALENICVPAELRGCSAHAEALELLKEVGLSARADHYPRQLSGGEQQRVALARAFVNKPSIIFADEPTGSLDRENAQRALAQMLELNRSFGTALLLVTHDAEVSCQMSRTIRLRGGEIVA